MRKRLLAIAGRAAALLLGLSVALAIAEIVTRVYEGVSVFPLVPPEPYIDNAILYQPNSTRLYELRPGVDAIVGRRAIHIHINHAGMRDDRDLPREEASGVYRVAVLGDSFAFGGKVQQSETFSQDLERQLQSRDPSLRYEALNLAVPGYNTVQEMLSLKESGLAYHPDLVILNFVLNDAGPMQPLARPSSSYLPLPVRRVLKRSDLFQLSYVSWKRGALSALPSAFRGIDNHRELVEGEPGWNDAKAALAELKRLCAEHDAHLLVVVWPLLVELTADYPHREEHQLVASACEKLHIAVLDLLPTFEGYDASTLWVERNDHHPNAAAFKMATNSVVQLLVRERWISQRAGDAAAPVQPAQSNRDAGR
jgi:GDSL-like Lipase/Acylhydrolase family